MVRFSAPLVQSASKLMTTASSSRRAVSPEAKVSSGPPAPSRTVPRRQARPPATAPHPMGSAEQPAPGSGAERANPTDPSGRVDCEAGAYLVQFCPLGRSVRLVRRGRSGRKVGVRSSPVSSANPAEGRVSSTNRHQHGRTQWPLSARHCRPPSAYRVTG